MRVILQRVSSASVSVGTEEVASIGAGFLALVGIAVGDGPEDVDTAVSKIRGLRVFPDDEGRMNLGIADVGGSVLVVSQFTLYAEMARGRRPSFTGAAEPSLAEPLIKRMIEGLRSSGVPTESGVFGAKMSVALVNDGPVTLVLDVRQGRVSS